MVPFVAYTLSNDKTYKIVKLPEFEGCSKKFQSTVKNLNKMLVDGHAMILVIPERNLSKDEIEEYRKYFCSLAKETKSNYVYFEGPVSFEEINPLEGTMFE